jgi:hypothetical protein
MPEKKKPAAPSAPEPKVEDSESTLVSVAKAIGHAAGTLAVKTGIDSPVPATSKKKGKLAPKNKQHLPRRQKKALQKAAASRI